MTGRLAVPSLKRSSTWWASRVVPHNHCRLDGSPEMGSSSDAARRLALKLQAIYNYPLFLFFFPGGGTSRAGIWGWVCEQQRQACHLTCVGAESLPVLFYPVPAGTTQCLNPFCGHGQTDTVECAWYVSLSVRYLSPFQTWILIYPGNYNQPATSCDGVAPAIYEFLFTVILLLAVNFEHLQRGITSTWSKLQVTPTGHALLALLLNFGMGTAIVFLTTIEVPYTVSLWTKVLFNQHLKHSSAF